MRDKAVAAMACNKPNPTLHCFAVTIYAAWDSFFYSLRVTAHARAALQSLVWF